MIYVLWIKGVAMWRNLFFLAGIPAIALVNVNCFYFEEQHPARPDFKPYEHMRKRSKVRILYSLIVCKWYGLIQIQFYEYFFLAIPMGWW